MGKVGVAKLVVVLMMGLNILAPFLVQAFNPPFPFSPPALPHNSLDYQESSIPGFVKRKKKKKTD